MNKNKIPMFFWATLSIAILVIAGAIAYYFVYFLPSKEAVKYQNQTQVQSVQEVQRKTDTQIREDCGKEGTEKAQSKLRKLIDAGLVTGQEKIDYEKAMEQGLAKRDDIDYYRNLCLENNGLK